MSDDAQAAEKVALTDAEMEALDEEFGDGFTVAWHDAVDRILAARVAEAVDRERANRRAFYDEGVQHGVDRERAAWAAKIEEATSCTGPNPRHYYSIDATCQTCEMPSWVEASLRALLAADDTEAKGCVCAPQWISSGGGCMCWPQEES